MTFPALTRRCLPAIVSVAAAFPLVAQASFTTFGTSCQPGLSLSASATPRLGTTFVIDYAGAIGTSWIGFATTVHQPVLLLGTSNTQAGGVALPAALPITLTAGAICELLVAPDVVALLPATSAPPFGLPVAIPSTPGLIGFTFHAQWLLLSERSLSGQVQWLRAFLSNAGTAVIGP
jgi:hypothetical protein